MENANLGLAVPRRKVFKYVQTCPLSVLLRFTPWLVNKLFYFQATERIVEYPFIHENIPRHQCGQRILDVGSGHSLLPLELVSKGYQVWSIDLKKAHYYSRIKQSNLVFVQGDIRKTGFPHSFFNIITAVSTIEHVGLMNKKPDLDGDSKALCEMHRILKPRGRLLITVPLGKAGICFLNKKTYQRVYDWQSLERLMKGYEIERAEFALLEDRGWKFVDYKQAEEIDYLSQSHWYCAKAVAMIVAKSLPLSSES